MKRPTATLSLFLFVLWTGAAAADPATLFPSTAPPAMAPDDLARSGRP